MNFTEKLIMLVQAHPCLYNPNHADYRNNCRKEVAWEKIATELNETAHITKSKWKNLKDGYTKYRKHQGLVGKRNSYAKWVWGPYMEFLEVAAVEPQESASYEIEILNHNNSMQPLKTKEEVSQYLPDDTSQDTMSSNSDPLQVSSRKRAYSDEENRDGIAKILKYLTQKENKSRDKDATDHLFASYAETFKRLKPRTQAFIKLRLAKIFAEAELSDLENLDLDPVDVKEEVT